MSIQAEGVNMAWEATISRSITPLPMLWEAPYGRGCRWGNDAHWLGNGILERMAADRD
jgi:hypothetical protein